MCRFHSEVQIKKVKAQNQRGINYDGTSRKLASTYCHGEDALRCWHISIVALNMTFWRDLRDPVLDMKNSYSVLLSFLIVMNCKLIAILPRYCLNCWTGELSSTIFERYMWPFIFCNVNLV